MHREKGLECVRIILCLLILYTSCYSLYHNYQSLVKNDISSQSTYAQIAQEMLARGVTRGYATFDYANTTTVVTNDAVQVRPVNNMTDMEGAKWLSNAAWYPPYIDTNVPVVYIASEYTTGDFRTAVAKRDIHVTEEAAVGDFTLFFTDKDVTVWRE